MSGSKFVNNITGSTIGAMAFGDGATAKGTVTIGGSTQVNKRNLRATFNVRGATSHVQVAEFLEEAAEQIRKAAAAGRAADIGAIGEVAGNHPHGVAWTIWGDE